MISRYSVKRPFTVLVGVVLIIILGVVSFTSMKTDLLPDMTLPYALVYTVYPGASPEEVETIVTRPVEQSMATISNIETVSSVSSENVSTVILEFSQSANMDAVTIEMREKLDQIEGYWDDTVGSPVIMKLNPDMLPVMVAALEAGDMTQSELTDLVNNEILPELESIEGVASVGDSGTIEEQVQVMIREDKIKAVNRRVRKALDEKFAEAESELEKGQDKLDEGKEELKKGQEELADQTSVAESKINSGSSQMITGQVQIDQKLAEVEAGLEKLDASEQELKEKEQELLEGEQALSQLPAQKEALLAQQAQVQAGIDLLEKAPALLLELDKNINLLNALLEAVRALESAGGSTGIPWPPAQNGDMDSEDNVVQEEEAAAEQSALPKQETPVSEETAPEEEPVSVMAEDEVAALVERETGLTQASAAETEQDLSYAVQPEGAGIDPEDIETLLKNLPTQEEIDQILSDMDTAEAVQKLESALAECQNQKNQLLANLAAMGVDTSQTGSNLNENIDTVKTGLITRQVQIADGISTIQKSMDDMPAQQATIAAGKKAIADGKKQISEGRTKLLAAKKELESAKSQIASGQTTVSAAVAQLNSAKISATIEMAVGKAELNAGQKELDAALEQIREQKETAYDQADVSQIITSDMVKGILAAQNFSMPAGYVTEEGVDFLVRVGK